MAKLRDDLVGVVYVENRAYGAGDALPAGVAVADSLVEPEAPPAPAPRKRRATKRKGATDVGDS